MRADVYKRQSALIAADGSAVLIETDGGKTAYTVEHT